MLAESTGHQLRVSHYPLSSPGQSLPTPATGAQRRVKATMWQADQHVHVDWASAMVSGRIFNLEYPEYSHPVRQEVPTKCPQSTATASPTLLLQSQNLEKRRVESTGWGQEENDSIISGQKTKTKQELRIHRRRTLKTLVQTESSPSLPLFNKHHPLDSWTDSQAESSPPTASSAHSLWPSLPPTLAHFARTAQLCPLPPFKYNVF